MPRAGISPIPGVPDLLLRGLEAGEPLAMSMSLSGSSTPSMRATLIASRKPFGTIPTRESSHSRIQVRDGGIPPPGAPPATDARRSTESRMLFRRLAAGSGPVPPYHTFDILAAGLCCRALCACAMNCESAGASASSVGVTPGHIHSCISDARPCVADTAKASASSSLLPPPSLLPLIRPPMAYPLPASVDGRRMPADIAVGLATPS